MNTDSRQGVARRAESDDRASLQYSGIAGVLRRPTFGTLRLLSCNHRSPSGAVCEATAKCGLGTDFGSVARRAFLTFDGFHGEGGI